jgi:pyruvate formate lyase activating enzyme
MVAAHIDPIEKKPLFHFHPGSRAFSVATVGCNFRCEFCQNWDISQVSKVSGRTLTGEYTDPLALAELAVAERCPIVAFTYSEPTVFFEWAFDVARETTARGVRNVFVTNGFIAEEPLRALRPYLHGANVDLKAFRNATYKKIMGAELTPVLNTLKLMKGLGIWVEVTTLVVPGMNDSPEELQDIARFIANELGPGTPWHVSRFHPDYRYSSVPSTPSNTLLRAYDTGRKEGLHFVYTGNMPGDEHESTLCHVCGTVLVRRYGFRVVENSVSTSGGCKKCGVKVPGVGMCEALMLPS